MSSVVHNVVDEVRLRVRSGGTGQSDIRHITEDVVATLPRRDQAALDIEYVATQVTGYGLLQALIDDPSIEEIWINSPSQIFVARQGKSELTNIFLTDTDVRSIVERMLAASGRRVDMSSPFVDATLPDGSRLHVVIPDITRNHWSVNIRKFVVNRPTLRGLVDKNSLTQAAARFLVQCVEGGLNIVVSGGTQAGKTTFMNALLNCAPAAERIITCEEVFELQLSNPDWVALQTRQASLEGTGEIPLRRLIKEALRMRPSRLVIGEVRHEECLDLLVAMNSGMPAMCSLHANGVAEALDKLCLLPMLAGSNISAQFVTPTVAHVVDLVVQLSVSPLGVRQVEAISAVTTQVVDGNIRAVDVFVRSSSGLECVADMRELPAKVTSYLADSQRAGEFVWD